MTECNRCGDCCNPVTLPFDPEGMEAKWGSLWDTPDPRSDENWPQWLAANENPEGKHWGDEPFTRELCITNWLDARWMRRLTFLGQHPESVRPDSPDFIYACSHYDTEAHACTIYEDRPPICANYPFYGRAPDDPRLGRWPLRCSFWADRPEDNRPEGWVPVSLLVTR